MQLLDLLIVLVGKTASRISRVLRFGSGATWPGEIALRLNPTILSSLASKLKKGVILVAGTNGKTTTTAMITAIIESQGLNVVHNASGANLDNGIVSTLIQKSDADWGVFEVDENTLPAIVSSVKRQVSGKKFIIVLLNLFRDQLDRYGEVDVIAEKWENALQSTKATIIANADDPLVAHLGLHRKTIFFGINDRTKFLAGMEHATDSTFCTHCGARLTYEGVYFSHLGIWACPKCGEKRPKPDISETKSPLPGLYNLYNTLAAMSVAQVLGIEADLSGFRPAFGRQEEIGNAKIFLSKNPTGFNQSLRTVLDLGAKQLLLVLNDRIPDGRDVSWIWDVDFEIFTNKDTNRNHELTRIIISGDRCWDMALRFKYAEVDVLVEPNLDKAIQKSMELLQPRETLYILPTYSAMLEVRKLLRGRKIL